MAYTIKHKTGTTDQWAASTIILKDKQVGYERCVDGSIKSKLGDGISLWRDLTYVGLSPEDIEKLDGLDTGDKLTVTQLEKDKISEIDSKANQSDLDVVKSDLADNAQHINNYEEALSLYAVFEAPLTSNKWATTDEVGRVLGMNVNEFLSLFYDHLVGTHDNGYTVTKSSLGKDQSGQYDLYEYVFTPATYTKTILLSSGMHPFELPASFGLAHFMNHLMVTPYAHEGFKYLKKNVRIKVIPVVNPWGFSQNPMKYGNSRGVNINRNFDSNGKWENFPVDGDEFNKKGTAPFSEAETQILRDWATANANASEFWMDCHTGANSPHSDIWIIYLSQDVELSTKLLSVVNKLENRVRVRYGREPITNIRIDNPGSIRQNFAYEQLGLHTFTLEGVNSWGTPVNNEAEDITEYEVSISAYVFNLLDISNKNALDFSRVTNFNLNDIRKQLDTHEVEKVDKSEEIETLKLVDVVLLDRFNRNNRIGIGFAETGQEWFVQENAYYELRNGKISGNNRAVIDTGISDYVLSVDIQWYQYAGVLVRLADTLNHYQVRINNTGLGLFKVVNGTSTPLGDYAFAPIQGKHYKLTVMVKADIISVYLDDVLQIQALDSTFNSETKVAVRAVDDYQATFDNFLVRKLPKGTDTGTVDIPITLINEWTGTITCSKDTKTGLTALRGSLVVGTLEDSLPVIVLPAGSQPSYNHSFNCYKPTTKESLNGFYISSSTGGLYARKPMDSSITTGETLTFNTVFHS